MVKGLVTVALHGDQELPDLHFIQDLHLLLLQLRQAGSMRRVEAYQPALESVIQAAVQQGVGVAYVADAHAGMQRALVKVLYDFNPQVSQPALSYQREDVQRVPGSVENETRSESSNEDLGRPNLILRHTSSQFDLSRHLLLNGLLSSPQIASV